MNQTAALLSSMLPYDTLGLYEQTKPSLMYRVPRVVPDQKSRFESDELFRRLSRESEVTIYSNSISNQRKTRHKPAKNGRKMAEKSLIVSIYSIWVGHN